MPAAIDPEQIPGKDLDPDAVELHAGTVESLAGSVRDNGSQVQLTWQRMAGVYRAPESDTLLGLMDPVSSEATASGDGIETVGRALKAFAADARPIKAELEALRLEARTFVSEITGGVSVRELNPAWVSSQGYQGSWNAYGASSSSAGGATTASEVSQYRYVTKEWHEVQDYVDRNNDLIARVNAQQVLLWEAERTCANTIRALYCAAPLRAATSEDDALAYGIDEIPAGTEMPWGAEVERTEGCGEATVNFVFKDFLWEGIAVGGVWGTVEGLGTLVLGYDPATGDFFSGDAYGAAWGSLGQLALGGVIAATPPLNIMFAADDGMRQLTGSGFLPDEVAEFKDGLDETALNTGKALIAWDQWADDPGTALGESVFNVGTILIPGGAAVAGVKTAGTAASVLSRMARFTDLVDPGAWAVGGAVRVGGHAFSGIGDLMARLDSPTFSGLDVVDLGDEFGQPAVLRADSGQAGMTALVDELGIDPDTIVARVDDGIPLLEAPGVRVELPGGAFADAGGSVADTLPERVYSMMDGVAHESRFAPEQLGASRVTDSLLQSNGITRAEFIDLIDRPIDSLSTAERAVTNSVRDALTAQISPDTVFQKVLDQPHFDGSGELVFGRAEDMVLADEVRVTGSVSVADDTAHLTSPRDFFTALRLDYPGTNFARDDASAFVVRFQAAPPEGQAVLDAIQPQLHSRMGGDGSVDHYTAPFTGNGFLKPSHEVLPEYRANGARMRDGAEVWEVLDDGTQRLFAVLRGTEWIPQGN